MGEGKKSPSDAETGADIAQLLTADDLLHGGYSPEMAVDQLKFFEEPDQIKVMAALIDRIFEDNENPDQLSDAEDLINLYSEKTKANGESLLEYAFSKSAEVSRNGTAEVLGPAIAEQIFGNTAILHVLPTRKSSNPPPKAA
jgi:hypothetical protein